MVGRPCAQSQGCTTSFIFLTTAFNSFSDSAVPIMMLLLQALLANIATALGKRTMEGPSILLLPPAYRRTALLPYKPLPSAPVPDPATSPRELEAPSAPRMAQRAPTSSFPNCTALWPSPPDPLCGKAVSESLWRGGFLLSYLKRKPFFSKISILSSTQLSSEGDSSSGSGAINFCSCTVVVAQSRSKLNFSSQACWSRIHK
mmetsp:Transcript_33772/g.73171  ORF Transcript_33772/g.73171 Transcript_33772/m.73171 type:complete len:202 (-) Transcript_33772:624-1229(-)